MGRPGVVAISANPLTLAHPHGTPFSGLTVKNTCVSASADGKETVRDDARKDVHTPPTCKVSTQNADENRLLSAPGLVADAR